ncbi:hypothetical protein GJ744_012341 [Endocarpon pusillum]|uniref:Uncharacterized protein n=1 Tax=Endocarpon pusillum TaxID=364733 RepID=A0A8H7ADC7_9EURO|nr:hypothetical protein GJ744_012341 [Endocarpon pusillum]
MKIQASFLFFLTSLVVASPMFDVRVSMASTGGSELSESLTVDMCGRGCFKDEPNCPSPGYAKRGGTCWYCCYPNIASQGEVMKHVEEKFTIQIDEI